MPERDPIHTALTNTILNDCQWDDGSENPNDKPDPVVIDGYVWVYTCINGVLGSAQQPQ